MAAGSKITAEVNVYLPVEPTALSGDKTPLLHLKRIVGNNWVYSSKLTILYLDVLTKIASAGAQRSC
ncbi:hypothetical protein MJO29_007718 [Puccinia striiformis f. sp. tritici]|nr:hypothetical protein MJO29_007718 [Puccinia striiformis f. sp. tritici]